MGWTMAKPIKIKNRNRTTSYRIFIQKKIDGKVIIESKTFSNASIAQQWHDKRVKELEYESIHGKAPDDLIGEIIDRYQDQYANSYGRSKNYDIARLLKHPIAEIGVETEGRYDLNENLNLTLSYSYHGLSNTNNTGLLPEHMIKGLINWEFTKDWVIGSQLNWIGERKRPINDPRPNLSDYFIVGLTLSTKIAEPLEFTLRANNLLGTNAKEPSLNPTLLPGDVPVTDRSILGQIKWSF